MKQTKKMKQKKEKRTDLICQEYGIFMMRLVRREVFTKQRKWKNECILAKMNESESRETKKIRLDNGEKSQPEDRT